MFIRINRSPEGDMGNGGAAPDAQPVQAPASTATETAQSEGSQAQGNATQSQDSPAGSASAPAKDQSYFDGLKSKLEYGTQLSPDEIQDMQRYFDNGEKPFDIKAEDSAAKPEAEKQEGKSGDAIAQAMKAVGAKSAEELPEKVAGLIKQLTGTGSQHAEKIRTLTAERDQYSGALESQQRIIEGLLSGDPSAMKQAQDAMQKLGRPVQPRSPDGRFAQAPQPQASQSQEIGLLTAEDIQNSIDPEAVGKLDSSFRRALAEINAKHERELAEIRQAIEGPKSQYEQMRAEAERGKAVDSLHSDISRLAESFPDYKVESGNLRDLLDAHFRDGTTDPRIEGHVKLLQFALKNNILDLELAHKAMSFEDLRSAQALAKSQGGKEAVQKLLNLQPTAGVAGTALAQNNINITLQDVQQMASGAKPVPREIMDRDGNIDWSKLPSTVRAEMGLA